MEYSREELMELGIKVERFLEKRGISPSTYYSIDDRHVSLTANGVQFHFWPVYKGPRHSIYEFPEVTYFSETLERHETRPAGHTEIPEWAFYAGMTRFAHDELAL